MLPTNVMSFVKKMVTTQGDTSGQGSDSPEDGSKAFSKLRQLGNELITATGNVTKLSPAKMTPTEDCQAKEAETKPEPGRPASRAGACRVCLKPFKPEDFSRTCYECRFKVCEDCASYSEPTDSEDPSKWRCSVCRRKLASRGQPVVAQESTESLLDVPVLEALQRRHSEARLNCQAKGLGTGLAPPRSPDIRRHSDFSPASLKELEKFRKVAGERREELRWERELEWRSRSRGGSPDRRQSDRGRAGSPQRGSKSSKPDAEAEAPGDAAEEDAERWRRSRTAAAPGPGASPANCSTRRKSTVTRQRSYDDEHKAAGGGDPDQAVRQESGLGLPGQLSRRASAYDVYALPVAANQGRLSFSSFLYFNFSTYDAGRPRPGSRESAAEERPCRDVGRRASFRAVKPLLPYEMVSDQEKVIDLDAPSPAEASPAPQPPPEEEKRLRRRVSQLPDIGAMRALPSVPGVTKPPPTAMGRVAVDDRDLPRQGSLVDGEGIKIVIHDVDSDHGSRTSSARRVVLRKETVMDDVQRRGFGMRVVGGKRGSNGRTYARVVWTVPGGPAEKAGLQYGDRVLKWGGVSLTDRSFDEVSQIVERTGDTVEVMVEHTSDPVTDPLDEPGTVPPSGKPGSLGLQLESDTDKTPTSPTRRKLPKTPEQIARERQITGRVQIQVWYEAERKELVVSILAADDLSPREDTGYGTAPEAYAKLLLVPSCGERNTVETSVAEPTKNPIWNATLNFSGVPADELMTRKIEVTLWDDCPDKDNVFLGECTVELKTALLDDGAIWYRLEDPRGFRMGKSPHCSPRGSFSQEVAQRLLRRVEPRDRDRERERSLSEDTPSESGSPEPYFLHPDHAWHANSRRGSSQSEQLEVEPYELSKDYSRSLPGSRRSSFQSQGGTDSKRGSVTEVDAAPIVVHHHNRDRRRSSCARPIKVELARTLSLSSEKRRGSRRGERKDGVLDMSERFFDRNSESDEDDRWSQPVRSENGVHARLGPGQVRPKGIKIIGGVMQGEIQLGFSFDKGTLEVEVICARGICPGEREKPDTYVKTYLLDGERWLLKRKTRVYRQSTEPQYRQTIKYGRCDAFGRNLLVMLWERNLGFESNQGLGGAEIDLGLLPQSRHTVGWYPLFPIHALGSHSHADSP
ncbi:regulating synaptic membrane exocytosis protein 1 [Orussus abietinus]|uniref:regulating synaptic membrane exocytosis protein 1 n=1 Tax=Orussus abietinus TaxID=222816 RepID=UPI000C7160FE|nr:regulating synaptic membrane exocytosis protein 1 [Orussus abietinus]